MLDFSCTAQTARVPAALQESANPDILPASSNDSHQMTYRFSQDDLSVLCEVLWSQSRDRINSIASTTSQTLPYTN